MKEKIIKKLKELRKEKKKLKKVYYNTDPFLHSHIYDELKVLFVKIEILEDLLKEDK